MTSRRAARIGNAVVNAVLCVCAIVVTAVVLRGERPISRAQIPFEQQANWREFAEHGNRVGHRDARVVLVEFSDYQCPACRAFESTVRAVREKYRNQVAVIYRHFPLKSHRFAIEAAVAAECASDQHRFETMHETLFAKQDSIGVLTWEEFAATAGVPDRARFTKCMRDPAVRARVDRDVADAGRASVRATPTILVDARRVRGALPLSALDSIVRAVLERDPSEVDAVSRRP